MAVLFSILVSCPIGIGAAAAGDGTAGNPYLIASKADLAMIASYPSASFKQTADIEEAVTAPLLDASAEFTGTYDGGGYSIQVNITTTAECAGLFSKTNGAAIKNLTVKGSISTGYGKCGAIAGQATATVFENCVNQAVINATAAVSYVGGIAGYGAGTGTAFKTCKNKESISGNITSSGGILGSAEKLVTFTSCANYGTISTGSYYNAGGIAGHMQTAGAEFIDCFNSGNLSANGQVGGILGVGRYNVTFTNCYNTGTVKANRSDRAAAALGEVTHTTVLTMTNCYNTGMVKNMGIESTANVATVSAASSSVSTITNCYYLMDGTPTSTGTLDAANRITAEMLNASGSTAYTDSFYYDHPLLVSNPEPDPESGSKENPYRIADNSDFVLVSQFPNAYFEQIADITVPVTTPLLDFDKEFTGSYDGCGYAITLQISSESDYTALFPKVNGGVIQNLTLDGSVISTGGYTAALVGLGTSVTLKNCVNKAEISGANNTGGLIGVIAGTYSKIESCRNDGNIHSTGNTAGGILGLLSDTKATVSLCANYGDIDSKGCQVGGIAGFTYSRINSSFNMGDVKGGYDVGGIAGQYRFEGATNCYNLGNITAFNDTKGTATAFGCANHTDIYSFENCYNTGEITSPADGLQGLSKVTDSGATLTYTNCAYLALNPSAETGVPSGVTALDRDGLKALSLGDAYTAGTFCPELNGNLRAKDYSLVILTVSVGENGTASFVGSKYVKDGISYPITFTPDETYELDKVFINTVEQPDSGEALIVPVSGDTTVSATFAEKQAVAPSASVVSAPFIPDTADSSYTFATINYGYGYEVTGYGILYSEDPDAITNAPETCETILEHVTPANGKGQFGIQLTGELPAGGYYTRAYVTYKNTATQETFTVYSDVIVEVK